MLFVTVMNGAGVRKIIKKMYSYFRQSTGGTPMSVHSEAMRRFDIVQSAVREDRRLCLKDRRFYSIAGAQWEGRLGKQFENKPKLEINKIALSVMRIIGEQRNNRITVDFISKQKALDDTLANTLDGMYRSDEQDSVADEAYDNAFEEAVGGGIGAWRLRTVYEDPEDPESEFQRIAIEPIVDADSSVFFDLSAKRQDKKDAKFCFVVFSMTPEDYMLKWPDAQAPSTWDKSIHQTEFDWNTPDTVYVAEYYVVEKEDVTVQIFETISGDEEKYIDPDDEKLRELDAIGTVKVREKKIQKKRVRKYVLGGIDILEETIIAGPNIPIVMSFGKRWFIDNLERTMGHVRLNKDPQRLKNMQMSYLAEISALSAIEKPIFYPEQVAGHQQRWAEDNLKNHPYLTINPITDKDGNVTAAGPIGYTKPPTVPLPLAKLLAITEQDMKDIQGNQQEGAKVAANLSGAAIGKIQMILGEQSFIYFSNHAKAIKRSGEIWLGMAKEIFVENDREVQLIGSQNNVSSIKLNQPEIDPETNQLVYKNDISKANFNIAVSVGPSSSSKKEAAIRTLTAILQQTSDPETQMILQSLILMNTEGEGLEDTQAYYRQKMLRMGVVQPNEKERKQLEEEAKKQQPTPEDKFLLESAENEKAKAGKARSDTALSLEKTKKTAAETLEIFAGIDRNERQAIIDNMNIFNQMVPARPQQGERVGVS